VIIDESTNDFLDVVEEQPDRWEAFGGSGSFVLIVTLRIYISTAGVAPRFFENVHRTCTKRAGKARGGRGAVQKPAFSLRKVVRPGGLELPTFWFVAIRVKTLTALFGVAYGLERPFFPHLAAPNVAPKTESYRVRKLATDLFQLSR